MSRRTAATPHLRHLCFGTVASKLPDNFPVGDNKVSSRQGDVPLVNELSIAKPPETTGLHLSPFCEGGLFVEPVLDAPLVIAE